MTSLANDSSLSRASTSWLSSLASCVVAVVVLVGIPSAHAASEDASLAGVAKVAVASDLSVLALEGKPDDARVLIYLHGRCGDPLAGIRAFPEVARQHGTMISILGDTPCPNRPRRMWTASLESTQERILAAISAVEKERGAPLDPSKLTLIGYSAGAIRAESLAKRFPDRYPRVVMIASPRAPTPEGFRKDMSLVTMVGDRDAQETMRSGTAALEKAGLAVRFFLLPGARHGQYGDEGARVVGEALAWADRP